MGLLKEFKQFAAQGNALDLAIGVVIGAGFKSIVDSLVNDILNPIVSLLTGGVDLTNLFINLSGTDYATLAEAKAAGANTINYGFFLNTVVQFIIIAFVIFLFIKQMNKLRNLQLPLLKRKKS